ncbi:MAG TPA: hypothetical protein PKC39_13550 [Ferruginibacter sp.]|nr:hypothetical protein [Ferruginibacter sp.]HMP21980.1 hypothetical protein [Ferruginibacter sp.]
MLFKQVHLNGIKHGEITLAFRKWQKPAVKNGTLLHTSIGLLKVSRIEAVKECNIVEKDAIDAGFKNKEQLMKSLSANTAGTIFKIHVAYFSEDPRIELREQTKVSTLQAAELKAALERLDRYSKQGNWTMKVLHSIEENPNLHAIGIAQLTGFEKEWLKINIRKLKNLGLTISHTVGYELSPKGKVFLNMLSTEK